MRVTDINDYNSELKLVSDRLDEIDIIKHIQDHSTVSELMDFLDGEYPFISLRSDILFDFMNEYEFIIYLEKRYGIKISISEVTINRISLREGE